MKRGKRKGGKRVGRSYATRPKGRKGKKYLPSAQGKGRKRKEGKKRKASIALPILRWEW